MSETMEICDFGVATPATCSTLADLHAELLPTSPLALIGKRFMRDFYYALLPAHDIIRVSAAFIHGEPAGFVAYTASPNEFMGVALRRWWPRLAWTLCSSILAQPSRIRAMWEARQIMSARSATPSPKFGAGEILSLGVLPRFRDPGFVQRTNLRLGRELTARAVDGLFEAGVSSVFAIVDSDNFAARLMYQGLGWRLTRNSVPGWRVPSVEYSHTLSRDSP